MSVVLVFSDLEGQAPLGTFVVGRAVSLLFGWLVVRSYLGSGIFVGVGAVLFVGPGWWARVGLLLVMCYAFFLVVVAFVLLYWTGIYFTAYECGAVPLLPVGRILVAAPGGRVPARGARHA